MLRPARCALLLSVATGCGVTAITVQQRATAGQVDSQAPAFVLPTHRGDEVASAALAGQRVALVFYRGHW